MEGGMIKGNFNYDVISKVKKKNFKLEKKIILLFSTFVLRNLFIQTMSSEQ